MQFYIAVAIDSLELPDINFPFVHYIDSMDLQSALDACIDMEKLHGVTGQSVRFLMKELDGYTDFVFHIAQDGSIFLWGVSVPASFLI